MNTASAMAPLSIGVPDSGPTAWEQAYLRFETPEQEILKFRKRLLRLGAHRWPRDSRVVELFCGRGNGLRALHLLGFRHVEGIDLSPQLAARYEGPGELLIGDCRHLPFEDASRDVLIVQGGLHHLPELPSDLEKTLAEVHRVLRPGGLFIAVEPWFTPFLRFVHAVCEVGVLRSNCSRLDALATMIEHERVTYEQWLKQPDLILRSLQKHFVVQTKLVGWGKLMFVGSKS